MIELPGIKELIEKGDKITVERADQVRGLCRMLKIDFKDGKVIGLYPPYLFLFIDDCPAVTAYGSRTVLREDLTKDFVKKNYDIIKKLNEELFKIYNKNIEGFE